MTRWNPCCCAPPVFGLTGDAILVRAGWYHFLAMTIDGKINCFIGSGLTGQSGYTFGGVVSDSRRFAFLDNDWARVNESVYFSDPFNSDLTIKWDGSSSYNNWDNFADLDWKEDVVIQIPGQSVWQANLIVGGSTDFIKYNCSNATEQTTVDQIYDKTTGICRGNPLDLYGVTVGYPGATGPIVSGNYYYGLTGSRTGCWFERTKTITYDGVGAANVYNFDFYNRYWPHGYFGIDGQGCTFERPYKINGVTSDRWKFLITAKHGTAGDTASVNFGNYSNGVTGDVVYEEYKPPVIPAPVGHPLRVPTIPTITENDETRP